ncbi:hypothetical protein BXZ70DRAFT_964071 [Cristinia sonorae]|uniref:Uncharacterized protein n=1 Tax=Cristinia sonorae TaxID=1940300 RepID=A0A8K0XJG2_9AGAR|nr:hypothetical protein BXZ70DRAFT_964071 [Cristinia sonorae]
MMLPRNVVILYAIFGVGVALSAPLDLERKDSIHWSFDPRSDLESVPVKRTPGLGIDFGSITKGTVAAPGPGR